MKKLITIALAFLLILPIFATGKKEMATPASATSDGVLKLAVTTGDGSSTDDKIPTPWYNRSFATNLMFRSLFVADSSLTTVKPDLAAKYDISADGLVYSITLKDSLKWSDGSPLTTADVVWSIESARKTTRINAIYTAAFNNISSISANGNVVKITLSKPYAAMLDTLAQFAILPKHSLEKADITKIDADPFWTNTVSSGMYALDEFNVGNYFTLKANTYFDGASPKIKNITVSFVADFVTAAKAGTADYVFGNGADLVESMLKMTNYSAKQIDVLFYKYFIFNMKGIDGKTNPAMQNAAVRKALMEAIDRATLATLYPNANVLNSGVPNSHPAYNGFSYKYDAAKAKKDLMAAGYDMTRPLKICYYNNDQTSIDLINTIVHYLQQVGISAEATLSNDGTRDLFTTRDYDIGFKGKSAFSINEWYTEYISSDSLFGNIFGGDTSFDALISELSSATSDASKNDILKKLQVLEQEKAFKIPVFTVGTYVFVNNRVKLPAGVSFCNPLYSCDLNFANWELVK